MRLSIGNVAVLLSAAFSALALEAGVAPFYIPSSSVGGLPDCNSSDSDNWKCETRDTTLSACRDGKVQIAATNQQALKDMLSEDKDICSGNNCVNVTKPQITGTGDSACKKRKLNPVATSVD